MATRTTKRCGRVRCVCGSVMCGLCTRSLSHTLPHPTFSPPTRVFCRPPEVAVMATGTLPTPSKGRTAHRRKARPLPRATFTGPWPTCSEDEDDEANTTARSLGQSFSLEQSATEQPTVASSKATTHDHLSVEDSFFQSHGFADRRRGRTGSSPDWLSKTQSFRVRARPSVRPPTVVVFFWAVSPIPSPLSRCATAGAETADG
jgi:hypothetical protein